MFKYNSKKIGLFIILILFIAISFSACLGSKSDQKSKAEQQSTQEEQQSEEVPSNLKDIESNLEKIIKALDGPAIVNEDEKNKESEQQQGQQQGQQQQGQQQQGQQQQGQQQQGQQQQGQQQQGQQQQGQQQQGHQQQGQQQVKDPWVEIGTFINDLHYQWNSYMPEVSKKGADKQMMDNFDSALNNLTLVTVTKEKEKTLLAANGAYAYIPDMYSLYRTEISPEIKRMRYYIRSAILNSTSGNWSQSETDIGHLMTSWPILKSTLGDKQQDDSSKIDFSLNDFDKVIKAKSIILTDIKGKIALSNIETIEKSLENS